MSEELKPGPAGEEANQELEASAVKTTEDSATEAEAPAEASEAVVVAPAVDESPAAGDEPSPVEDAEQEPDGDEPIGPRWYSVRTSSQPEPVNLLLRAAVRDHAKNEQSVIERFKLGHGITETPHKLYVGALPADYVPTARDVDHHEAIEAALASVAAN